MENYFKLKLFLAYIWFVILVIIGFILFIISIVARIKEIRIEKFFTSHGYERKLLDVPRFGNGAFYGWVRKSDNKIADDRDIKGLLFKEIKERYI